MGKPQTPCAANDWAAYAEHVGRMGQRAPSPGEMAACQIRRPRWAVADR